MGSRSRSRKRRRRRIRSRSGSREIRRRRRRDRDGRQWVCGTVGEEFLRQWGASWALGPLVCFASPRRSMQVSMELEQGKSVDFWRDMTISMEEEITKLWKLEAIGKGPGERREEVNALVSADVQSVLKGKTYNQL